MGHVGVNSEDRSWCRTVRPSNQRDRWQTCSIRQPMRQARALLLLEDRENGAKELKHELIKISWYMRGGMSYSEAMALSPTEREIIAQLVKDNLETTKKSGQPFF